MSIILLIGLGVVLSASNPVSADIVSIIDPPGGGEIDEEVGNLSEAAFEALGPRVNDHEHNTGPQGADAPFNIGSVVVTGQYGFGASGTGAGSGNPWVLANLSGNRSSFTVSGVDVRDNSPAGTWMYGDQDPGDPNSNYVQFVFTPPVGETVTAVGLAWMGRDNRATDSSLTSTVTFNDGAMLATSPLVIDGTGDGLPNGKDVFIGFEDTGNHGGIAMLEVFVTHASFYFNGWDDIGVVTSGSGACCTNGPGTQSDCVNTDRGECEGAGGLFLGAGTDCIDVDDCVPLLTAFESMSAVATSDGVLLHWTTSAEIDTVGFRVLREGSGSREKTLDTISPLIPAAGDSFTGATYRFLDNARESASAMRYYVEDVDVFGKATRHGPMAVDPGERQRTRERSGRKTGPE